MHNLPCSQTSLYRSPKWVRSYGQLQCLLTSLYRSPMAGIKLANLSLQITPCKEDEKKFCIILLVKLYGAKEWLPAHLHFVLFWWLVKLTPNLIVLMSPTRLRERECLCSRESKTDVWEEIVSTVVLNIFWGDCIASFQKIIQDKIY